MFNFEEYNIEHKGLHQHRFDSNPLEKAFADKWEKQNKISSYLEYLLSDEINTRKPVIQQQATEAATVIQWLGSPVGFRFLLDVLFSSDEAIKHIEHELKARNGYFVNKKD